jgi:hypothetical protein
MACRRSRIWRRRSCRVHTECRPTQRACRCNGNHRECARGPNRAHGPEPRIRTLEQSGLPSRDFRLDPLRRELSSCGRRGSRLVRSTTCSRLCPVLGAGSSRHPPFAVDTSRLSSPAIALRARGISISRAGNAGATGATAILRQAHWPRLRWRRNSRSARLPRPVGDCRRLHRGMDRITRCDGRGTAELPQEPPPRRRDGGRDEGASRQRRRRGRAGARAGGTRSG